MNFGIIIVVVALIFFIPLVRWLSKNGNDDLTVSEKGQSKAGMWYDVRSQYIGVENSDKVLTDKARFAAPMIAERSITHVVYTLHCGVEDGNIKKPLTRESQAQAIFNTTLYFLAFIQFNKVPDIFIQQLLEPVVSELRLMSNGSIRINESELSQGLGDFKSNEYRQKEVMIGWYSGSLQELDLTQDESKWLLEKSFTPLGDILTVVRDVVQPNELSPEEVAAMKEVKEQELTNAALNIEVFKKV